MTPDYSLNFVISRVAMDVPRGVVERDLLDTWRRERSHLVAADTPRHQSEIYHGGGGTLVNSWSTGVVANGKVETARPVSYRALPWHTADCHDLH